MKTCERLMPYICAGVLVTGCSSINPADQQELPHANNTSTSDSPIAKASTLETPKTSAAPWELPDDPTAQVTLGPLTGRGMLLPTPTSSSNETTAQLVHNTTAGAPPSPDRTTAPSPETAKARAAWRGMAREILTLMENNTFKIPGLAVLADSYQTEMSAYFYGWQDSRTQALLNKVYSQQKPDGGYGLTYAWDAFGDHTTNPISTSYTVTSVDHVGQVLLEGYKNGAVPANKITSIVDSLLKTPVQQTPNGYCMAYSSSPNDAPNQPTTGCIVNVSIGAASFLKNVVSAGILNDNPAKKAQVQSLITKLKPLGLETYNEKLGDWPYRIPPQGKPIGNTPQDYNHEAYTFESGINLYGLTKVKIGAYNALKSPVYGDGSVGDGTVGRVRLQSDLPGIYPQNSWRDAVYALESLKSQPNTPRSSIAQLGLWAMRLASDASAGTIEWRPTDKLMPLIVYSGQPGGKKVLKPYDGIVVVKKGTVVTLETAAQDGKTANVFQPIQLNVGRKPVLSKPTNSKGEVYFQETIKGPVCFDATVNSKYTTNKKNLSTPNLCFKTN